MALLPKQKEYSNAEVLEMLQQILKPSWNRKKSEQKELSDKLLKRLEEEVKVSKDGIRHWVIGYSTGYAMEKNRAAIIKILAQEYEIRKRKEEQQKNGLNSIW